MVWNYAFGLALVLGITACASRSGSKASLDFPAGTAPTPAAAEISPVLEEGATIVTPSSARIGRISLVNNSARYVVVTYAVGDLPARDATLNVFRDGLKVAELKITDFSRDINAAADIMAGDCQVGDEVREQQ